MEKKRCPFFEFCGAEVIREHRGENWRQRFCFAGYEECVHFQAKKQTQLNKRKEASNDP